MNTQTLNSGSSGFKSRYLQLLILLTVGGAIYPMLYMRQIYEISMLYAFQINNAQLGKLYSLLGLFFFLTYGPSGWLADKLRPMLLITISLVGTGLLGLWYATLPSYNILEVIFVGWGITTGLTFWGAVMKRVRILSGDSDTGKFYGIYDGGRGLVEAILASVALYIFGSFVGSDDVSKGGENVIHGLQAVIYMYSFFCIGLGVLCAFFIASEKNIVTAKEGKESKSSGNLIPDIIFILKKPEVWLIAVIIMAGYHIFWATYSFSAYLQAGNFGFTAVMAGAVTTIKLWMRPIGGSLGGYLGDKFSNINILIVSLIFSALGLFGLIAAPVIGFGSATIWMLVFFILMVGLLTYAIRGLYWAIIEHIDVPESKLGLAIGIISVIGYCPDIFIPLINGNIIEAYKDQHQLGYQIYFGYIIAVTIAGIVACFMLRARAKRKTQ